MFKKWFKKKEPIVSNDVANEVDHALEQVGELDLADAAELELEASIHGEFEEESEEEVAVEFEEELVPELEEELAPEFEEELTVELEILEVLEDQMIEGEMAIVQADESLEAIQAEDGEVEAEKPAGLFKRLFQGLDKTRKQFTDRIDQLVNNYGAIDDELFDELEEILIMADIGMETAMHLIKGLKAELKIRKINDASQVKNVLRDVMVKELNTTEEAKLNVASPSVVLVIGVNGAGKTTSIGKIANLLRSEGKTVLLAAADTFRAAAIDQLVVWGQRAGIAVVSQAEGADPASVVYDAIHAAKARKTDVLICDTAGRLHNKKNLMDELNKIFRIIDREYPEANREVLLVLDATTGQNAIQQAKLFQETAAITGVVLTKLDGTAKGGFVFAVKNELGIPIKLVGVGERIDDLQHFNPETFSTALMEIENQ